MFHFKRYLKRLLILFALSTSLSQNSVAAVCAIEPAILSLKFSSHPSDTLELVYTRGVLGIDWEQKILETPTNEHVTIIIDSITGPTKVSFNLKSKRAHRFTMYVQPGQLIEGMINDYQLHIQGQYMLVYKIAKALDSVYENSSIPKYNYRVTKTEKGNHIESHFIARRYSMEQQLKYLNSIQNIINNDLYESIRSDIMGYAIHTAFGRLSRDIDSFPELKELGRSVLKTEEDHLKTLQPKRDWTILAGYQYAVIKQKVENKTDKSVFDVIHSEYKGDFRDNVLAFAFLITGDLVDSTEFRTSIERAIQSCKTRTVKEVFRNYLNNFTNGSKFFDFSLPDTAGRVFSLNSFKGKIVLVDWWYTGCSNCIVLADLLKKEVIPIYEDKGVVFLSINTDADTSKWKKSVLGGKYTSPASINLNTGGYNHSLAKFYQIEQMGAPRLMLLDREGRIITIYLTAKSNSMISALGAALNK